LKIKSTSKISTKSKEKTTRKNTAEASVEFLEVFGVEPADQSEPEVVIEEFGTIDTITDTHAGIKEVEMRIFFRSIQQPFHFILNV
jgi:hypothetical protein